MKEKQKENKELNLINQYHTYTIGDDKNLIKNGERCWPDYIKDINNKREKTIKKAEFYKKIGKLLEGYRKTKLEDLDYRAVKKFILEGGVLYNNRIINDPITNKKIIKKFRISKSREIKDILYEAYNKRNYGGVNATNYYILHYLNIYWINIINDIKLYIKKCLKNNFI